MYYRNQENNQQEQSQFQEYADFQCPWADSCPYLQANNDAELRQNPYNRPRPRPHYPMQYHPYHHPYYTPYHHPFYHPYYPQYYHHPYEHYYQPHPGYEHSHGPGRDEE